MSSDFIIQSINYNKRRVDYFDDKTRWNSVYDNDVVKNIKESDYIKGVSMNKLSKDQYEYGHEENLKQIVTEGLKKNEEGIRSR